MSNRFKKIISSFVLISLIGFYFVSPITVRKTDAFLGVADQSFNFTIGDVPRFLYDIGVKITKFYFEKLKKRMITQLQNDLVNWVQGNGEPRFITNPKKFVENEIKFAGVSAIDRFFSQHGTDICSPFRVNVEFLVSKPTLLPEEQLRCSFKDMKENVEKFANNFEDGGWTTWLKLHETRNTLPGSYLATTQLVGVQKSLAGNMAQAKLSAGKGFLDQKKCSLAAYKVFNLEFDETDGATTIIESKDMPPDVVTKILDPAFDAWTLLWPEISKDTKIEDVITSTIHLVPTGETITTPIEPPGDVPPGATCAKEKTVTPGSIVGDQISGTLKSTGIDKLINAQDIAQILDAVLDAAVNRAAKEGLSHMKSGRGSYTTPFTPRKASLSQRQLDGLESSKAITLQNQIVDLRSAAIKLKNSMTKLTGKKSQLEKLETRLSQLAGAPIEADENIYVQGVIQRSLRASGGDKKLSDVLDRLFDKYNSAPKGKQSEAVAVAIGVFVNPLAGLAFSLFGQRNFSFRDGTNFNKEENNPGAYLANQLLNKKLAEIWRAIKNTFDTIDSNIPADKKSCIQIDYTLEPEITTDGNDQLPFIDADGKSANWNSHKHSYIDKLKSKAKHGGFKPSPRIAIIELENFAVEQSALAFSKTLEYEQMADIYGPLTQNSKQIIQELSSDIDFATTKMRDVALLSSLLIDYDKAGREYNLLNKIKNYNEALGGTKKISAEDTTGEDALLKAYDDYLIARKDTENKWRSEKELEESTLVSGEEKDNVLEKIRIIEKAIAKIDASFIDIDNSLAIDPATNTKTDDPTQLGLVVSDAVSQAISEVKNIEFDVENIRSELEERQIKIGQQQTDVSNRLGKFPGEAADRKQASLDGGESEWEKYFKNRFQLAYSALIYDFYKNYYIKEFCDGREIQPSLEETEAEPDPLDTSTE